MSSSKVLVAKLDPEHAITVKDYAAKINKAEIRSENINEYLLGTGVFTVIIFPLTAIMSFSASVGSGSVFATIGSGLLIAKLINNNKKKRFKGMQAELVSENDKARQAEEEINRSQMEAQSLLEGINRSYISKDSVALVESLTKSISNLLEERLAVEQEHEVKRILLDTSNVIKMTTSLAKYDVKTANLKLKKSLEQLNQEAQIVVEQQKVQLLEQIDSYQSYMEIRSQ